MQKVRLNINSKNSDSSSEKELIERARVKMEEKRVSDDSVPQAKKGRTGLFVLVSAILIAGASAGTLVFANKRNELSYKKFIPKSSLISASLPLEKLGDAFKSSSSLIFPETISKIKTETTVLGIDIEELLSKIQKDIIISYTKTSDENLSNVIIAQLPENFDRQNLENKIRQNFNVSYQNYRGEKIITVEPLELSERNKSFSYAIVENTLLVSQNIDALKLSVDAGK